MSTLVFDLLRRAEDDFFEFYGIPLKRVPLFRLMRLAQCGGFLHRCLNVTECMFVKLVIKLIDGVRSLILAKVLTPLTKKLLETI